MGRAGLSKEAVLHGVLNRIEIWNPERFAAEIKLGQDQLDALAAEVLGEE